jgi:hypothetical protein
MEHQKNACLCQASAAFTSHLPASRSPTRDSVLSKTRVFGPTVPEAASSANRSRDTRSMASGGAFVDPDEHELVVAQVAPGGQGHAVRHPLIDEGIGLFEHPGALRRRQRAFCSKNPEPGVRWKLIERDTGHNLHIVPRRGPAFALRASARQAMSQVVAA